MTKSQTASLARVEVEGTVDAPDAGMRWIPGGTFRMGSTYFYPEERPIRDVRVDGFWIDRCTVTNAQFAVFVAATGYVTVAERPISAEDFPGAPAEKLLPGSMLFQKAAGPVDLTNYANWWAWTPGTCWQHPRGPGFRSAKPRTPADWAQIVASATPADHWTSAQWGSQLVLRSCGGRHARHETLVQRTSREVSSTLVACRCGRLGREAGCARKS